MSGVVGRTFQQETTPTSVFRQNGENRVHFWGRLLLWSLIWHHLVTQHCMLRQVRGSWQMVLCDLRGPTTVNSIWDGRQGSPPPGIQALRHPLPIGVVGPTDSLPSRKPEQMWWAVSSEVGGQKDCDFHLACWFPPPPGAFSLKEASCRMWATTWKQRPGVDCSGRQPVRTWDLSTAAWVSLERTLPSWA